ncbi:MAG: thioredoxin domain-containing protein, partial [Calditrichaeota bacterium]|nr:thioredoxin domain-containing protein [Calditrichota bacterium]
LSRAAQAFDAPEFAAAATNAADFLLENMRQNNGKLFHRYRNGDAAINGYLDDYAFAIWGFTELYQTTFDTRYLQAAIEFTDILESDFWDNENGGYFFTADAAEQLLVRKKEIYDGAVPSGNSVMMLNLQRLARLTGRTEFENHAEKIGRAFSDMIRQSPIAYTMLLCGLDFGTRQTSEIVVVGDRENADTQTMIHELHRRFLPNAVVLHRPANERNPEITKIAPFTAELSAIENKATAYVCRNFACELPTTDVEKMVSLIEKQ